MKAFPPVTQLHRYQCAGANLFPEADKTQTAQAQSRSKQSGNTALSEAEGNTAQRHAEEKENAAPAQGIPLQSEGHDAHGCKAHQSPQEISKEPEAGQQTDTSINPADGGGSSSRPGRCT